MIECPHCHKTFKTKTESTNHTFKALSAKITLTNGETHKGEYIVNTQGNIELTQYDNYGQKYTTEIPPYQIQTIKRREKT